MVKWIQVYYEQNNVTFLVLNSEILWKLSLLYQNTFCMKNVGEIDSCFSLNSFSKIIGTNIIGAGNRARGLLKIELNATIKL